MAVLPNQESLSVIMPALNEEKNIETAVRSSLRAMDDLKIQGEIIVVNDGSTDQTGPLTQRLMQEEARVRMLRHEKPQGIGSSFWDGVGEARGSVVTMFPGDNENDPYEALRYFDLLKHVDMVIPFIYNQGVRGPMRKLISFLYRTIINATFGMNLNYTNGTVLYRKAILSDIHLQSTGFLYQTEILVKAIRRGYLFAEVPCSLGKRAAGASTAMTLRSLINVMKSYLQLLKSVHGRDSGPARAKVIQDSATFRRFEEAGNGKVNP
jgi:glycosyltransferase involved in cell wall biosynthesis